MNGLISGLIAAGPPMKVALPLILFVMPSC
ncbi:hypothetical protein FBY22_3664 [Streptomyces sp. SLBN-31]|nr:hypothetical protein FBY22_3664 [Streptomyces sp. SLBN-31]